MKPRRPAASALALLALLVTGCAAEAPSWAEQVEAFRADREERLQTEDGWLTLVGLHWLEPGANTFGSDPGNAVVLEAEGVPAVAGTLVLEGETVRLEPAADATLTIEGQPVTASRNLRNDNQEAADVVELGRLRFHVIRREEKFGIRVKDPESPARTGFKGLNHFAIDEAYRFDARFLPYDEPKEVRVQTAVDTIATMTAPGVVEFTLGGETLRLQPFGKPDAESFWFIFRDGTSGKETYGAGRYLSATRDGDRVDLDFNRAYNPPCAYSPHATCPLPPRANWLVPRIPAGERSYEE